MGSPKMTLLSSIAGVLLGAIAQQSRHPPPEAYTACASKKAGEPCEVNTPNGDRLGGVCAADDADRLFCRPEQPLPGSARDPAQQPPPAHLR
jgi:hypothetical protein